MLLFTFKILGCVCFHSGEVQWKGVPLIVYFLQEVLEAPFIYKLQIEFVKFPLFWQVILSQCGGSNKAGFTIVPSNLKSNVHLDGLFNIVSYDTVPKLQKVLMASDFKVNQIRLLCLYVIKCILTILPGQLALLLCLHVS